jgi:hypothetical protein
VGENWVGDGGEAARVAAAGVDMGEGGEAVPVEEAAAVADAPLPRNRWNVVLAAVCVLLLLAAGGVALRNRSVRDEADATRADAADLDRQRDEVTAQLEQDQAERAALVALSDQVERDLELVVTELNDQRTRHQDVIELERDAVGTSNDGNEAAARDRFASQGQNLLDILQRASEAVATRRAALDADIQHLKESTGA